MTVLIDTSAWVEYFRATGTPTNITLRGMNQDHQEMLVCGPVSMELKAGAKDENMLLQIDSALAAAQMLPVEPHHFDEASTIYRTCRSQGITVRSLIDCLIASVALSEDIEVLHHDRDFNAIARVVPLRIHPESLAG